jgi:hypothetical protein
MDQMGSFGEITLDKKISRYSPFQIFEIRGISSKIQQTLSISVLHSAKIACLEILVSSIP